MFLKYLNVGILLTRVKSVFFMNEMFILIKKKIQSLRKHLAPIHFPESAHTNKRILSYYGDHLKIHLIKK